MGKTKVEPTSEESQELEQPSGAVEDGQGGEGGSEPTKKSAESSGGEDSGKPSGKNGFPEETPIAEMTIEQQAAYWKYHSRSNESKAKKYADGLTKEEAEALQQELEQLRSEKLSDEERATEEALNAARAEGENAARERYLPMLQQAQLQGYASTVIAGAKLNAWVAQADVGSFLNEEGDVDGTRVVETLTALFGDDGKSSGGNYMDFGQGRGKPPAKNKAEAGLEAARRRGHIKE